MNNDKSHLYHIEKQSPNSEVITDVIIGISDGLTVPFALAAGLSAIVTSTSTILVAGISAAVAGAIAMGFGGYFTGKSEMNDHHQNGKGTDTKITKPPVHEEKDEAKNFFARLGLSEDVQEQAAVEVIKDKEAWANVLLQYDQPKQRHSARLISSGFNIAVSYVIGGLLPLLPYSFINHPSTALKYSAVIAIISLFFLGWIKGKFTGTNRWSGALRETIIGALAGGAAFLVATIFRG